MKREKKYFKFTYIQCGKSASKFTYILLKLGKCGDKDAISIDQKMITNNESLLIHLLFQNEKELGFQHGFSTETS